MDPQSHMPRNLLILTGAAALVWGVLALALDSPTLRIGSKAKAAPTAASPACLPTAVARSAALPGTSVDVSPGPETRTANPHTQVSFLGVPGSEIRSVSVVGGRSGPHPGHLRVYSQGDGASFVPDTPFDVGESVEVGATVGADGSEHRVSFRFGVDTPYPTARIPSFPNPVAAPADYESFDTLPGVQAPIMNINVPDRDPGSGDILTTNGPGPGQYGPLIYTPQGRLVWFERLPGGETAEDLSEQTYQGQRSLTWWRGRVLALGFGQGEDIVTGTDYRTLATVHGGNGLKADLHDFQLAPDDVAYITAYNPIRCDLTSVKGARDGSIVDAAIQEIDMRTGLVRWEWHSLDHVRASESEVEAPHGSTPWDWFHLNSIDLEPDGDIFISARSTWAGYQLLGRTGTISWTLGGLASSFKMGPGTETAWQHDGRVLADGEVTFFDDGSNPPIHSQSRGVRIGLDFHTHQTQLIAAFTHTDPPLLAPSQGTCRRSPTATRWSATAASQRSASTPATARWCSTPSSHSTRPSIAPSGSPGTVVRRARRRSSPLSTTPPKRRSSMRAGTEPRKSHPGGCSRGRTRALWPPPRRCRWRALKARRSCRASTPTRLSRRWTRPATCSPPRRPRGSSATPRRCPAHGNPDEQHERGDLFLARAAGSQ